MEFLPSNTFKFYLYLFVILCTIVYFKEARSSSVCYRTDGINKKTFICPERSNIFGLEINQKAKYCCGNEFTRYCCRKSDPNRIRSSSVNAKSILKGAAYIFLIILLVIGLIIGAFCYCLYSLFRRRKRSPQHVITSDNGMALNANASAPLYPTQPTTAPYPAAYPIQQAPYPQQPFQQSAYSTQAAYPPYPDSIEKPPPYNPNFPM